MHFLPVSIISAVAANGVIGNKGELPWPSIREDFAFFRNKTLGHPVIMGAKTWESLPEAHRPLKDRTNIVLSFDPRPENLHEDVHWVKTPIEALTQAALSPGCDEIFIIGGASIYALFAEAATTLYLTKLDDSFEGDTRFPNIPGDWEIVSTQPFTDAKTGLSGSFIEKRRTTACESVVFPEAARGEEKIAEYRAINSMKACPFCHPAGFTWNNPKQPLLREGKFWGVFANYNPYEHSKFHFLVIAKHHVSHCAQLPAGAMQELAALVKAQCEAEDITSWSVVIREHDSSRKGNPLDVGQSVVHLHAHIVVPHEDAVVRVWFGRPQNA